MWRCAECGEEVEPTFDVCWNCGAARDGGRDEKFQHADEWTPSDASPGTELDPVALAKPISREKPAEKFTGEQFIAREPVAVFAFDTQERRAKIVAPDTLVEVVAYATPLEADLIREQLTAADIDSCLGNESVVFWCWIWQNALCGMRVLVRSEDYAAALDVIDSLKEPTASDDASDTWTCTNCGQAVANDWHTCWACGTGADGTQDDAFEIASTPGEPLIQERFEGEPIGPFLAFVFVLCPPLIFAYGMVKLLFRVDEEDLHAGLVGYTQIDPEVQDEERGLADRGSYQPDLEQLAYESVTVRAVRASIFGCITFFDIVPQSTVSLFIIIAPAFNIYSAYLLFLRQYVPWEPANRFEWRVLIAFTLNLILIPLGLLMSTMLTIGMSLSFF